MGITNNYHFLSNIDTSVDLLEKITDKYRNHRSIELVLMNTWQLLNLDLNFNPSHKNQASKLLKLLHDKKQNSRQIYQ